MEKTIFTSVTTFLWYGHLFSINDFVFLSNYKISPPSPCLPKNIARIFSLKNLFFEKRLDVFHIKKERIYEPIIYIIIET